LAEKAAASAAAFYLAVSICAARALSGFLASTIEEYPASGILVSCADDAHDWIDYVNF
jgi:hypothetical protein